MDFRRLTYIVEVAKARSVTAAAHKLYISQPALSQVLAQVEAEVGVKLFDRRESPLRLTYAGELYVATAKEILASYETMKRRLADVAEGNEGKITLGLPVERSGYMLPEVLAKFQKTFPQVSLLLEEGGGKRILDLLENHDVDLVILPKSEESQEDKFQRRLIYPEEIFVLAQKPLPEAQGKDYVEMKDLAAYPFILVKPGHAIRLRTDEIFRRSGVTPRILLETASNLTAAQMASRGLGLAIVPKRTIDVLAVKDQLQAYTIGINHETWDVDVIARKDHYFTRSEEYLIRLMQEEFSCATV